MFHSVLSVLASLATALVLLCLGGCATVEPADAFGDVRDTLAERSAMRVEWRGVTAEDEALDEAVARMLAADLSADRAVQVALLNNRRLQATYEELGIAQADLVQAGLLHNPVFDFTIRWPDESPRTANIEMSVVLDFLDVLFIPARKRIAADRFEATRLRVADEVIALGAEVREAFYRLQGAQQMLEMRQSVIRAGDAAAEMARRMRAAGNITELELAEHEAFASETRLELTSAQTQVQLDRERLARLMGISGAAADHWRIATRLPELPRERRADPAELEALALAQRLDLQSARRETAARARAARLADATRYFEEVEIGAEAERETDGVWLVGPTVSAPIPLFDQGQASLARARAEFRRSRQRYLAAVNDARAEARTAAAELASALARVEHFRDVVLPLRARVVEQAQLEYNGMLIGVFELLDAKRQQVEAGRQYIDALREYWIARSRLERAVGGELPRSAEAAAPATTPATTPATAPATQPRPDQHQHQHHGG